MSRLSEVLDFPAQKIEASVDEAIARLRTALGAKMRLFSIGKSELDIGKVRGALGSLDAMLTRRALYAQVKGEVSERIKSDHLGAAAVAHVARQYACTLARSITRMSRVIVPPIWIESACRTSFLLGGSFRRRELEMVEELQKRYHTFEAGDDDARGHLVDMRGLLSKDLATVDFARVRRRQRGEENIVSLPVLWDVVRVDALCLWGLGGITADELLSDVNPRYALVVKEIMSLKDHELVLAPDIRSALELTQTKLGLDGFV